MFEPIRTPRLVIRSFTTADVDGLFERRNDPDVARWQNWTLPFSREKAEQMVSGVVAMDGPTADDWWMAVVEDAETGETHGDLAVGLTWEGRCAEVGYTFARSSWGRGFAVEALGAMIDHLFGTLPITRCFGMLHPDNPASAMVLERCGMLFEGHTRLSYWVGDDNSDDWIYGMTRRDWELWRTRPRHRPAEVALVPVTAANEREVVGLRTHKTQEAFVAPMLHSFADALFPEEVDGAPVVPWMRAIVADGEIVGFLMMALTTTHHPEPFLWRLLIDRMHQRRGIASMALDLLEVELVEMGDATMLVSWETGRGSPEPFYLARGFEPTGRIVDGEVEARKRI